MMDIQAIFCETERALLSIEEGLEKALSKSQELEERREIFKLLEHYKSAKSETNLLFESSREIIDEKNKVERIKQEIIMEIGNLLASSDNLEPSLDSDLNQIQTALTSFSSCI